MTEVVTPLKVITVNLKKSMKKKLWEEGLNTALNRMGPRTVVGLQEAYTLRNKGIVKRVCEKRGLAVLGLGTDSTLIYNPNHLKVLFHKMHPVEKSSKLFVSPTRFSLIAQFNVLGTEELFGVLVNHRMNGVYTADAPLKFFEFRKSAWVRHKAMDAYLVRTWSKVRFGGRSRHVPIFCLGDENAHRNKNPKYSFPGNPFDETDLLHHHVSDYIAVSEQRLTPNHRVEFIRKDSFKTGSDHLALEVVVHIHHTVKDKKENA